jgi:hypothetical protein
MLTNLIYAFQQAGSAQKVSELQELRSLIPWVPSRFSLYFWLK